MDIVSFRKNKKERLKNFVLLCYYSHNWNHYRARRPVLCPTYVRIKLDRIKLGVKHYRYICIYTIQNKRYYIL